MKSFAYTVADPAGIHARAAGILVRAIKGFDGTAVTVERDGKSADGRKLMELVNMGVRQGDAVTVTVKGGDEETAAAKIEEFFKTYF